MDQKQVGSLVSELAQGLHNKQKFGAEITDEYIEEIVDRAIEELVTLPEFEISDLEIAGIKFKLGGMYNIKVGEYAVTLNNPDIPRWFQAKKSKIPWTYWDAYDAMLVSQARSRAVVKENERVIDKVLDFSGDPTFPGPWARKGLVMGNVQSGKTQNYLGLVNKAIDSGYKVIILLGGHLNDLRKQTQERVDEGIVGRESKHLVNAQRKRPQAIGVGKFRKGSTNVHTFTTTEGDFSKVFANNLGVHLTGLSEPAIFTVKKNTTVLKNLFEWIRDYHLLVPDDGKKLDLPMMLIDDEADYASVNTKAHKQEVTQTNHYIRQLLSLFSKNTYIGYTATPFANIFIDPESEGDAINDDLFPKDFMVKIQVPKNYVGQDHFFGEEPEGTIVVSDCENVQNLKSESVIAAIPETLKEAVRAFVIVVAIRAMRGEKYSHNTMLVNVSHLRVHQDRLEFLIETYREHLCDAVESFSGLGLQQARANSLLASIENTFETSFNIPEKYEDVFPELVDSVGKIKVWAINQGKNSLDYSLYEEYGLSAIVIGGHRLSRGLTLEGLSVSYFTRNSKAYDTLMQMCRWFGYRPRYKDLCRVYLPYESLAWYSFITSSIRELYSELDLMSGSEKRPSEFGLKVREHPGSMIITAKNKMSTAESIVRTQDLWGQILRRFRFKANEDVNLRNLNLTKSFIRNLESRYPEEDRSVDAGSGSTIFSNVSYAELTKYVKEMELPEDDVGNSALFHQLQEMEKAELPLPRVCLFNQSRGRVTEWEHLLDSKDRHFLNEKYEFLDYKIRLPKRAMKNDGVIYSTPRVQLGNSDDEKLFLNEDARDKVKLSKKNAVSFDYLCSDERDFPGLIIYLFGVGIVNPYPFDERLKPGVILGHKHNPTVGFSLSLPRTERYKNKTNREIQSLIKKTRHSYQVNRVYQEQLAFIEDYEGDEDE
jgi:hypothetical protein